jgi:hypothetical protein
VRSPADNAALIRRLAAAYATRQGRPQDSDAFAQTMQREASNGMVEPPCTR